ncbi:MAG TPA: hypothetical protein VJV79_16055 [Polyangiaceae bacterium]|nr:hypothetical protein [Polyangiaceae bacterium]
MLQKFTCLALLASLLVSSPGSARTAALLAVGDATQLSELQLAKVMADDSSLWLSVRLKGRTRLALVVAEAAVEVAPAAHAWLRALDSATRVRVAPPPGPLAGCGSLTQFELADSGLPESRRVAALEVASVSSELELRRLLADAGLAADVSSVAQFTSDARPPFQVVIYDAPALGGSTEALRLADPGHPEQLPEIALSGAKSLPLSLIALAKQGVLPLQQPVADPSELSIIYRAIDQSSDYLAARGAWLGHQPTHWLNEAQANATLFAWTVFSQGGRIAPVVSRYFEELTGTPTSPCLTRVQAAYLRSSVNAADFVCDGADDLSRSLAGVGFAELRLSRFFGMMNPAGGAFRVAPGSPRAPLWVATDLDLGGCPDAVLPPPNAMGDLPDSTTPPPVSTVPNVVRAPDEAYREPTTGTPASGSDGSCAVTPFDSTAKDSCSGNTSSRDSRRDSCSGSTSSSDSRRDSCSGSTSSADSGRDSCSGDSSSADSGPDSCSGDASDSSSDGCSGGSDSSSNDTGCGKSEYDGDTCSGDSADGNSGGGKGAALRRGTAVQPRPRQVRLSLLTLLAAAMALPLRRLCASR